MINYGDLLTSLRRWKYWGRKGCRPLELLSSAKIQFIFSEFRIQLNFKVGQSPGTGWREPGPSSNSDAVVSSTEPKLEHKQKPGNLCLRWKGNLMKNK
jgi:hypothetical protein